MKDLIKDYCRLLHVPTLLVIALTQVLLFYKVLLPLDMTGSSMTGGDLCLLVASTLFVAMGAFVINDYYDLKIDEINRPLTRVVGKRMDKHLAMTLYISLSVVGVLLAGVLSWNSRSTFAVSTCLFAVGLMWFYSSTYKRILWLGNLLAALVVAMVPLTVILVNQEFLSNAAEMFGPYEQGTFVDSMGLMFFYGFTFFWIFFCWTFVAEVIKDMATEKGDRELECHTFPIVYGVKVSKGIVYVAILLTCGVTAYFLNDRYSFQESDSLLRYYLTCTVIPAISLVYVVYKASSAGDYRLIAKYDLAILVLNMDYFWMEI